MGHRMRASHLEPAGAKLTGPDMQLEFRLNDRVHVEAVRVHDRPFPLGEGDDRRAAFLEELRGVVADVPEALDGDALAREAGRHSERLQEPGVREGLLDLKIRVKMEADDSPVPLQQDIRLIDYLQEFTAFIDKKGLSTKQREYVGTFGADVLRVVMDEHRETAE